MKHTAPRIIAFYSDWVLAFYAYFAKDAIHQLQGDAETRDIFQLVVFTNSVNLEHVSFCATAAYFQYEFALTLLL